MKPHTLAIHSATLSTRRSRSVPPVPSETTARAFAFLDALQSLYPGGPDFRGLIAETGLEPGEQGNIAEGEEVGCARLCQLLDVVDRATGRSSIGLRLAGGLHPDQLGTFGALLTSSPTLANAVLVATRYIRLISEMITLELHVHGTQATLVYAPRYRQYDHPLLSEAVLGTISTFTRMLTGQAIVPLEVRFTHAAPIDIRPHVEFFGAPVRFGQAHNGYVFPSELLQLQVVGHSPARRKLHQHGAEDHGTDSEPNRLSRRVVDLLNASLLDGEPTSTEVADALGMHPKTLSRRLRLEGTSYQLLLNQLRQRLAEHYLGKPELTVSQVADRLGYSENSTFCRAFKRWTGLPPQAFRREVALRATEATA